MTTRSAPSISSAQVELVGHERRTRAPAGRPTAASPPARPPAAPAPSSAAHVDAVVGLVDLGQPLEPAPQQLDLGRPTPPSAGRTPRRRRRSACARRTHRPCRRPRSRWSGYSARSAPRPPSVVAEPPTPTRMRVGAGVDRRREQLAGAGRGGADRVVALGAADQRQARRPRHLDHGRAPGEAPLGVDRLAEGTGHDRACGWGRRAPRAFPRPRRPPAPRRRATRGRGRAPGGGRRLAAPSPCPATCRGRSPHVRSFCGGTPPQIVAHRSGRPRRVASPVRGPRRRHRVQPWPAVVPAGRRRRARGPPRRRGARVGPRRRSCAGTDTLWVAAAMSDGDREAAAAGVVDAEDFRVRLLGIDPETYRLAYDVISNQVLWFLHHGLYDLPREPRLRPRPGRRLAGVPHGQPGLRRGGGRGGAAGRGGAGAGLPPGPDRADPRRGPARPRRRPLPPHPVRHPDVAARAPASTWRASSLSGLAAHRACGFHTARWASDFVASSRDVQGLTPRTFVSPLPAGRRRRAVGRRLARLRGRAGRARRDRGRPRGGRPGRPHRAVEEPAARLPGLRRAARPAPRVARAGRLPGVGVPVAHRRPRLHRVPAGRRGAGRADQRALGHPRVDADRLRHQRRLPPIGGRAATGRRAAGQPDP